MFNISDFKILNVIPNATSQIPYGVQLIGSPLEWNETKGKGIKVAVLDTGKPQHKDIKIAGSYNATGCADDLDHHGHSTHCCGIVGANGSIMGVAPEVELYAVKVLADDGAGSDLTIADGIEWCIKNNIDVISMSLGGANPSEVAQNAVKKAYDAGIVLVAAAGNEYKNDATDTIGYPAKYNEVLAVAAIDKDMNHGWFSSSGQEIDVATAGVNVYSTWLNNQYAELNGTSMACPHMSGAIAILQAKAKIRYGRKLTPQEVFTLVQMYAEDIGMYGKDVEFGYGVFTFGRFNTSEYVQGEKNQIELTINSNVAIVNGVAINMDTAPIIDKNNRTLVPLRFISEQLGKTVTWDGTTQKITIK